MAAAHPTVSRPFPRGRTAKGGEVVILTWRDLEFLGTILGHCINNRIMTLSHKGIHYTMNNTDDTITIDTPAEDPRIGQPVITHDGTIGIIDFIHRLSNGQEDIHVLYGQRKGVGGLYKGQYAIIEYHEHPQYGDYLEIDNKEKGTCYRGVYTQHHSDGVICLEDEHYQDHYCHIDGARIVPLYTLIGDTLRFAIKVRSRFQINR